MFTPTIERALAAGLSVRGYVSMCYGDPWEGDVPIDQVVKVGARLVELGCHELSLGDTIGVATPGQVISLIERARRRQASAWTSSPSTSTTPTARRSPTP